MLESGEFGQLDEWIEYDLQEPSDSWRQASLIAAAVHNLHEDIRAFTGKDYQPQYVDGDHFIPKRAEPAEEKLTLAQGLAQLRMMTGV